jgi:hypothetical protein
MSSKVKLSHYSLEGDKGERRYGSYSFMTLAIDGVERSASHPGCALIWGKDPRYPLDRKLSGPQSCFGYKV